MIHELSCSLSCSRKTNAVHHIIKTGLEERKEHLPGHSMPTLGFRESIPELLLGKTEGIAEFLLFAQANAVVLLFAVKVTAMLSRGISPLFEGFGRRKQSHTEATVNTGGGSSIAGHSFKKVGQVKIESRAE